MPGSVERVQTGLLAMDGFRGTALENAGPRVVRGRTDRVFASKIDTVSTSSGPESPSTHPRLLMQFLRMKRLCRDVLCTFVGFGTAGHGCLSPRLPCLVLAATFLPRPKAAPIGASARPLLPRSWHARLDRFSPGHDSVNLVVYKHERKKTRKSCGVLEKCFDHHLRRTTPHSS